MNRTEAAIFANRLNLAAQNASGVRLLSPQTG
jgi:hypothetical protein